MDNKTRQPYADKDKVGQPTGKSEESGASPKPADSPPTRHKEGREYAKKYEI